MSGIVIIGTGLAGYTLARELRKLDKDTPLTLVTADDGAFYSKPMLSNAFASNKDPEALISQGAEAMAGQLDARILTRRRVASMDTTARQVRLEDGETLAYDRLVLAVGAEPIRLSYEGDGAEAVLSVNSREDYARFREAIEGVDRVAVIGPGLIGCEFANDLRGSGREVDVIGPDTAPLGRLVPEAVGRALQKGLEAVGIRFHLETVVERIDRAGSGLRLTLSNGETVEAGTILSAVGLRPDTRLAGDAGLEVNRGIVVDRTLATSAEDVYALGDCAEVSGLVLPYVMPIMHGARALAKTLAGEATEVSYPAMPVVVKTPAHPVVVNPPSPGADGEWQIDSVGEGVRALFRNGDQLGGFVLTGAEAVKEKQALARHVPAVL
ncbi:NAD(P)/FAD-dependent oxidoreductase [Thioalkalivibrio sulfidiphilus]|uniref:FAD-dependent pyridine nucleotide-disulphide oxidoreductase n=1 Tax=Thioalkalivibrio sulfidiphilus (strain HL-EbGR7) TaxID=396588 RepID=B8GME1_THISH|nr:FAD-dependent oxidoreductase [Thioalkalivibrio sulfidiphilus]ACL71773.1 FAD-dependent pyridine nucleotide-disulphide oxidoreductase [Thioalkalivibrio sulfidiphilus HL-EbGr7]